MGGLPNCAVDGIPYGMSNDWDGIAFDESRYANCSDCYVPVDVTNSTLSCGSNSFLVSDTTGKSCVVNCSYAISGTAASTVLAGSQYFTCSTALCLSLTALLGSWVKVAP